MENRIKIKKLLMLINVVIVMPSIVHGITRIELGSVASCGPLFQ
jgi:hypothetical protein